jgi:membrane protein DedA with SNARE-associated domain
VDFLNSDTVQHLIGHYGYGAIFVIVMLESAGVPMPGETILVTAAAYPATKHTLDQLWQGRRLVTGLKAKRVA